MLLFNDDDIKHVFYMYNAINQFKKNHWFP